MTKEVDEKKYRVWYCNLHAKNIRLFGKANKCENTECTKKSTSGRFEWALKKGCTYSNNRHDFIQLCPSCHRKYDETEERKAKIRTDHKGKTYHNRMRHIVQIDSNGRPIAEYTSITNASIQTKITRTGISNCLSGLSHSSGGFKWKYK